MAPSTAGNYPRHAGCGRAGTWPVQWQTTHQRGYPLAADRFTPVILSTTSSKCHLSPTRGRRRRIWFANGWPNLRAHCRTFVADDDAAGRQQLLNHVKPERETEIQPNGMADDLGRA